MRAWHSDRPGDPSAPPVHSSTLDREMPADLHVVAVVFVDAAAHAAAVENPVVGLVVVGGDMLANSEMHRMHPAGCTATGHSSHWPGRPLSAARRHAWAVSDAEVVVHRIEVLPDHSS